MKSIALILGLIACTTAAHAQKTCTSTEYNQYISVGAPCGSLAGDIDMAADALTGVMANERQIRRVRAAAAHAQKTAGRNSQVIVELQARIAQLETKKSCFELPEGAAQVMCLGTVEKAITGSRAVGENVLTTGVKEKGKAFKGRMYVGKTDFTPEILMEAETAALDGGNADLAGLAAQEIPPAQSTLSPGVKIAIMGTSGLAAGLGTGYLIGKDGGQERDGSVRESTRLQYSLAGGGIGLALGLVGGAVWAF